MQYPQHVLAAWAGHDEQVAQKHYLAVADELYDKGLACSIRQ
jgi:hypothetical protein